MSRNRCRSFGIIAVLVLGLSLAPSLAWGVPLSHVAVDVSAGSDWGTWWVDVPVTSDPFNWQLATPVDIYSTSNPGLLLATIDSISMTLDADPAVVLNFNVIAGAVNTNFTISSPNVAFTPILNPMAFATAAITVTDNNGDGGTLTGLFPGVKAYEAQYNGAGSVFADLVSPVAAPAFGSGIGQERLPAIPPNRIPIAGLVSDIESDFSFTLTAFDSASGTSRFDIIPEPSSLVLALIGGVALAWHIRRRRK